MKVKLISVLLLLFVSLNAFAFKRCECGSFSSGITAYHVGDGQGCCTGVTEGMAVHVTYAQDQQGTWHVTGSEVLIHSVAQANCCPAT